MNSTMRPTVITNNSTLMSQSKVTPTVFQLDSHESKIIARCFYFIILIFGTFGNVLTCYVIISRKFMRRVIHIYTFNLAVADLMVILLYVPVEIVRNENDIAWTMGLTICKINNIVTPTSLIASICTLVAITLDRHRGVTRPFHWRGDSSKLLLTSIPAMWIIAIICSAPLFMTATVVFDNGAHYCVEGWYGTSHARAYWIAMFIIQVLLPFLVIVVANTHMIYVMQSLSGKTTHSVQSEQHKQHRRMICMVVALALVYAICTSPQHIVFFWSEFGNLESQRELSQHVYKASNLMVIAQCAINPVIYGIGRKDFKGAFKSILRFTMISRFLSISSLSSSRRSRGGGGRHPSVNETLPHNPFENGAPIVCINPGEVALNNRRVEKLRKKSSAPTITDTPPPYRRETEREQFRRTSEPISKKQKKGLVFTRKKNLSLPASLMLEEEAPASMVKHSKMKEEKVACYDVNGTPNMSHFEWDFNADELALLVRSPETVI